MALRVFCRSPMALRWVPFTCSSSCRRLSRVPHTMVLDTDLVVYALNGELWERSRSTLVKYRRHYWKRVCSWKCCQWKRRSWSDLLLFTGGSKRAFPNVCTISSMLQLNDHADCRVGAICSWAGELAIVTWLLLLRYQNLCVCVNKDVQWLESR